MPVNHVEVVSPWPMGGGPTCSGLQFVEEKGLKAEGVGAGALSQWGAVLSYFTFLSLSFCICKVGMVASLCGMEGIEGVLAVVSFRSLTLYPSIPVWCRLGEQSCPVPQAGKKEHFSSSPSTEGQDVLSQHLKSHGAFPSLLN